MKKALTLCMVCREGEVLLGLKKRGFGEGRWNGFGGKVEEGELLEDAAVRELKEEAGITAREARAVGVLTFSFESEPDSLEVHVFSVSDFAGTPVESEEMRPSWFPYAEIPYDRMWPDDIHWFPYLLGGKLFRGQFHFDRPSDATYSSQILRQELREVQELP